MSINPILSLKELKCNPGLVKNEPHKPPSLETIECFPSTLCEKPRGLCFWQHGGLRCRAALQCSQSTRRLGPRLVRAPVVPERKMGKGCLEARAGRSRETDHFGVRQV